MHDEQVAMIGLRLPLLVINDSSSAVLSVNNLGVSIAYISSLGLNF